MEGVQGLFEAVPLDYFILGGIAIVIALDAMRSGIGRAAALVVALTAALFFSSLLSDTAFIAGALSSPTVEILALCALVAANYFFLRRIGLEYLSGGIGQPLQAAIAGVCVAIVCVIVWLSTPAFSEYWEFSRQIQSTFAEQFRLFWLIGAFGALAFARG